MNLSIIKTISNYAKIDVYSGYLSRELQILPLPNSNHPNSLYIYNLEIKTSKSSEKKTYVSSIKYCDKEYQLFTSEPEDEKKRRDFYEIVKKRIAFFQNQMYLLEDVRCFSQLSTGTNNVAFTALSTIYNIRNFAFSLSLFPFSESLFFLAKKIKGKIVFVTGKSGAGKTTFCKFIQKVFNYNVIYLGNLQRLEAAKDDMKGTYIKYLIQSGQLFSKKMSQITCNIMNSSFQKQYKKGNTLLLDNFPTFESNLPYTKRLIRRFHPSRFICLSFNISDQLALKRTLSRQVCNKCQEIYNSVTKPPIQKDKCDKCFVELSTRKDDTEQIRANRQNQFYNHCSKIPSKLEAMGIKRYIFTQYCEL